MIRGLYNWTMRLGESRYALVALAVIAFVESSVFPIPPDVLLIPMIIALPRRAFLIAFVATVSSVLGGMFGYYIGAVLFDSIGQPLLDFYGKAAQFDQFKDTYNEYGAWAVLVAGVTPFPFKVITILSGSTGLDFGVFVLSSVLARAARFFVIAALLWKFGVPIRTFIEKRLGLVFTVALALLVGGFVAVKFF
ncbi:MAG TPA: DedA family protein [Rhodobacteraceae bacterium]|nr:DedA family protein [Paracoccaceae bacterium]